MKSIYITICLTVALFWSIQSHASEPVILKYSIKPGEVQVYNISMDLDMDISVTDGKNKERSDVKMKLGMGFVLSGVSAEENRYTLDLQFYSPLAELAMNVQGNNIRINMDESGMKVFQNGRQMNAMSWSEVSDPSVTNFGDLLRTKIRCAIAGNGELLDISGLDIKGNPIPGMDLGQVLGGQVVLPSHPIEIGDLWNVTEETTLDNSMNTGFGSIVLVNDFTYTLARVVDYKGLKCAVIDVKGTSREKDKTAGLYVRQEIKGETVIEISTGKVINAKVDIAQKINGKDSRMSGQANTTGTLSIKYNGSVMPKEVVSQNLVSGLKPELLNALHEVRVSMVLQDSVKIEDKFYGLNEQVAVGETMLRLLKFDEDKLYLKDESTGIIFRLQFNFKGEVTGVKPIQGKQG